MRTQGQAISLVLAVVTVTGVKTAGRQTVGRQGHIAGQVLDANGIGIPGVLVELTEEESDQHENTTTDEAGGYQFNESTGAYTVSIGAPGVKWASKMVTVSNDSDVFVPFQVTSPPTVALPPLRSNKALAWPIIISSPTGAAISLAGVPAPAGGNLYWAASSGLSIPSVPVKPSPLENEITRLLLDENRNRLMDEMLTRFLLQPQTSFAVKRGDSVKPDALEYSSSSLTSRGLTLSASYQLSDLTSPAVNNASEQDGVQRKGGALSFANTATVVASNEHDRFRHWSPFLGLGTWLTGPPTRHGALQSSINGITPFVREPGGAVGIEVPPSQDTRVNAPARPNVKLYFVDTGQSSGTSVRMTVVNEGSTPVTIVGDGFALEPVRRLTEQDIKREVSRLKGRNVVTVDIDAYCLNMKKAPPAPGMVMRLAPAAVQADMAPAQRIFAATRALYDTHKIQPDSDPVQYRHALLQWAIWANEQGFNEQTYTAAFVNHSKENVEAAKRRWTPDLEQAVRGLAPGRWRTIQRVLRLAQVSPEVQR